jgi:hypothetical protein
MVATLEPILRAEIRKVFPPHSCIQSCHILAALLEDFGMRALSLPVEATVFNRAYVERTAQDGPPPDWQTIERWHQESRAFVVRIGHGVSPGHLILITEDADGAALWDPSINQATEADCSLVLPWLLVGSPVDLAALYAGQMVECRLEDGTAIQYVAQPNAAPMPVSMWPLLDEEMIQAAAIVAGRIREQISRRSYGEASNWSCA